jgi:hypothetical protein
MPQPLAAVVPPASDEYEIPWKTLKTIGAVGGSILAILIVVTTIIQWWPRNLEVPKAEHISKFVAAARSKLAPPPPQPEAPPPAANGATSVVGESPKVTMSPLAGLPVGTPPADGTKAETPFDLTNGPRAIVTGGPQVPAASALTRLPRGVEDWHAQSAARLAGIRRVNPTDPPIAHFSWMTGLLPFLGHQQLYQRFDFQQPPTHGRNLQLGAVIVPEFLNPLDEQQRWKGYPFDGIALTHFVGISGVDDARNVVAAKLPRSDPRAGVFGYDEIARPEEITDGKSQTIMIAGAGALANPWVFGGGSTIRGAREPLFDKTSGLGMKGLVGGGSMVIMADGSVRHVSADVDPRVFKAMCTIHGADSVDLEHASTPFDWEALKRQ